MDCISTAERKFWRITGNIQIAGFEWRNDKPLALLLHANGFCAATWAPTVRHLLPHYHIAAFDFRGHGQSSAPPAPNAYGWQYLVDDFLALTTQLLSEKHEQQVALVAGSSLGGIIAAAGASERSELFQRIVMLDPPVLPNAAVARRLGIEIPTKKNGPRLSLGDMARNRRANWPSREVAENSWCDKPMFKKWDSNAFQQYLKYGFNDCQDGTVELACTPEVEASIFEQTGSINIFDRASDISCPVHVVHASGGHFPKALYQDLAGLCPQGEFLSIDAGHLLPMEVPELVANLLTN